LYQIELSVINRVDCWNEN